MEKLIYDFVHYIKSTFNTQLFKPNFTSEIVSYIYDDEESNSCLYDRLFFEFLYTQNISFEDYCKLDREKIIEYSLFLLGKENNFS